MDVVVSQVFSLNRPAHPTSSRAQRGISRAELWIAAGKILQWLRPFRMTSLLGDRKLSHSPVLSQATCRRDSGAAGSLGFFGRPNVAVLLVVESSGRVIRMGILDRALAY